MNLNIKRPSIRVRSEWKTELLFFRVGFLVNTLTRNVKNLSGFYCHTALAVYLHDIPRNVLVPDFALKSSSRSHVIRGEGVIVFAFSTRSPSCVVMWPQLIRSAGSVVPFLVLMIHEGYCVCAFLRFILNHLAKIYSIRICCYPSLRSLWSIPSSSWSDKVSPVRPLRTIFKPTPIR